MEHNSPAVEQLWAMMNSNDHFICQASLATDVFAYSFA